MIVQRFFKDKNNYKLDFSFYLNLSLFLTINKFYPSVLTSIYKLKLFKDKPLPLSFDNIIRMNQIALHLILKYNFDNFELFIESWKLLFNTECGDYLLFYSGQAFADVSRFFDSFPEYRVKLLTCFLNENVGDGYKSYIIKS